MATTMNHHQHGASLISNLTTITQKVCIGIGILFVVVGLAGIVSPGFMRMHLSMAHNLIHLLSGSLALWCGLSGNNLKAYRFCVGFGTVYGLLGVAGFVLGEPGYPGVGHMEADQNLLRVIPNVLEFGSYDHNVHMLLSAILLFTAYVWKKRYQNSAREIVDDQRRAANMRNSESNLSKAKLGTSDVNRLEDQRRRSEFENRI